MDSEATTGRSQEPLQDTPGVSSVQIRQVRLDPPVRFYRDGRLVSAGEAIELLVRTTVAMPVLDITPALFIGEIPVTQYEQVEPNTYRFRVFDVDRLQRGARISIGWPFAPAAKVPTPFVFEPGAPLVA